MTPDDMYRILEKAKNLPRSTFEGYNLPQSDVKAVTLNSFFYSTICVKARLLEFMYSLFYLKQVTLVPLDQN